MKGRARQQHEGAIRQITQPRGHKKRNPHRQRLWATALAIVSLVLVTLACAANAANMQIGGIPAYVCPSATPQPTSPPTYPPSFAANLDYFYVDSTRAIVNAQYLAQNVGWIQVSTSGTNQDGSPWFGGSGYANYAGNWPGFNGSYAVFIPSSVGSASITISSDRGGGYTFWVARYSSPFFASPNPPPSYGLPTPVYPTPYPTPTLYSIPPYNGGFYVLDGSVDSFQPPIQLRLRLLSPIKSGVLTLPFFGLSWTAASWTLQITNVGTKEYDFLGAGYMYVSEIQAASGALTEGVWSPSHLAAQFLGVIEQAYNPQGLAPGESITVTVAGWIPGGSSVDKVSLNLDPYHDGDPGWATFTPTQGRIATWVNRENTVCEGSIKYP